MISSNFSGTVTLLEMKYSIFEEVIKQYICPSVHPTQSRQNPTISNQSNHLSKFVFLTYGIAVCNISH